MLLPYRRNIGLILCRELLLSLCYMFSGGCKTFEYWNIASGCQWTAEPYDTDTGHCSYNALTRIVYTFRDLVMQRGIATIRSISQAYSQLTPYSSSMGSRHAVYFANSKFGLCSILDTPLLYTTLRYVGTRNCWNAHFVLSYCCDRILIHYLGKPLTHSY